MADVVFDLAGAAAACANAIPLIKLKANTATRILDTRFLDIQCLLLCFAVPNFNLLN
jgi:hypothetical protein